MRFGLELRPAVPVLALVSPWCAGLQIDLGICIWSSLFLVLGIMTPWIHVFVNYLNWLCWILWHFSFPSFSIIWYELILFIDYLIELFWSRKLIALSLREQAHLTEREKQKLQVWSQIMPYRESFAWAIVSLFDNSVGAATGGSASPSSPLTPSVSGSSSHEGVFEPSAKITLDGKLGYSSGSSVMVEISNLSKVKESYTEDSLQVGRYLFISFWPHSNRFLRSLFLTIKKYIYEIIADIIIWQWIDMNYLAFDWSSPLHALTKFLVSYTRLSHCGLCVHIPSLTVYVQLS